MRIEVTSSLESVPAAAWDALTTADDPFVEYAFLRALETSGSVGHASGWVPCHVLVWGADDTLVGALPLYAKSHSYGEYIFDWAWANAAARAGLDYYPKLVSAVPFTPAGGRRLLVGDGSTSGPVVDALLAGAQAVIEQLDASSLHLLFCTAEEREALERDHGLLARLTYQFHWTNQGWQDFAEYLASFRAPERRKVRKERREAAAAGLNIRTLRGRELSERQLAALHAFYRDTTGRKGAIPYLTGDFFAELGTSLGDRALILMAEDGDRPVAASLSFQRGRHLYGRYWGCLQDYDKLHFELCYYRPIELCLRHGWTRFEAGAQGEHKLKRGLLPSETWSAHWLRDADLSRAVADYLPREAMQHRLEMQSLARHGPFKRG